MGNKNRKLDSRVLHNICIDPSHMASSCRAEARKEGLVERWEESMGNNTDVFFPTKLVERMGDEEYQRIRVRGEENLE